MNNFNNNHYYYSMDLIAMILIDVIINVSITNVTIIAIVSTSSHCTIWDQDSLMALTCPQSGILGHAISETCCRA